MANKVEHAKVISVSNALRHGDTFTRLSAGINGDRQHLQKTGCEGSVVSGSRNSVYCLYGHQWFWTAWRSDNTGNK